MAVNNSEFENYFNTNIVSNISFEVQNVSEQGFVNSAYEWRFIVFPYCLIFILSISGNCFVIATLASNRRMRTVTNVYLLNLAVSDFLLGVFCLPFTLVGQVCRKFLFGAAMCKIIPFLQAVSVSVDVWTLVAISLERYFAICRPLKSRQWQTQCHAYKMIATVWIISITMNSPILFVSQLQPMKNKNFKCRENWTNESLEILFNVGLDAALFLIPFFIMSFAYSLIVSKLWRGMKHEIQHSSDWQKQLTRHASCKNCNESDALTNTLDTNSAPEACCKTNGNHLIKSFNKVNEEQPLESEVVQNYCLHAPLEIDFRHAVRSTHMDKSIEAKRKVIRMLFVIILNFFLCWTPLHIINTVYLLYPEELYQYIGAKGIASLQLLAYCSSCCNPITYCFMNRKFRLGFIHLIRSCKLFECCFSDETDSVRLATLQPSSQDLTNQVRGSHSGRTDLEGQEGEECV